MNSKPKYISVHSDSKAGVFEDAWQANEQAAPDWYIVDTFFKKQGDIKRVRDADKKGRVYWLAAGEKSKTWNGVERVLEWLVHNRVKRSESLAVIGGGTVLDTGLFVASIYQRGIRKWSIPTTLLATVDAGIGGKNGVNFMGFKNYIGTITQPDFFVSDFRVLETLSPQDVLNGWMEMTKHALIEDPALWQSMKAFNCIPSIHEIHPLIAEAAKIKKRLVEADEFESGRRKTLNFGHTVAHALESVAAARGEELPHGTAVGIGMTFSLQWSAAQSHDSTITNELLEAAQCIKRWLTESAAGQVQTATQAADIQSLWPFMEKDKKNDAQGVQEVRLTEIGRAEWNQPLTFDAFEASWIKVVSSI
jgi:3-dehydroquinate synthetase